MYIKTVKILLVPQKMQNNYGAINYSLIDIVQTDKKKKKLLQSWKSDT